MSSACLSFSTPRGDDSIAVCTTASAAFTALTYVFGSAELADDRRGALGLQPLGLFRIARQRRDPVATLDHRVEHGRPDVSGGARQKHVHCVRPPILLGVILVSVTTLVDLFRTLEKRRGEFLVYDDGYRVRRHSYADVTRAARGFASRSSSRTVY